MRPVGETVGLLEARRPRGARRARRCASTTCAPSTPGSRTFEERLAAVVELVGERGRAGLAALPRRRRAGLRASGRMGVDQILAVRPSEDGAAGLPPTPADLVRAAGRPGERVPVGRLRRRPRGGGGAALLPSCSPPSRSASPRACTGWSTSPGAWRSPPSPPSATRCRPGTATTAAGCWSPRRPSCGGCGWPAHIARRGRGTGEDPRYDRMLAKAPRQPHRVRAAHGLPAPGRAGLAGLAAGAGGAVYVRGATGPGRRGRRPAVGGRAALRGGRRPPAGPLHRRPRPPRPDHGPRAVALDPAPELLRRLPGLVGPVPARLRRLAVRRRRRWSPRSS